jgi:type IV pilus secretin PilQ/predicted competence protein
MVKVGSMRRAKRILLMASVLVVSLDAANASWFRHKADAPKGTAPTVAGTSLTAIDVDASRVVLRTSGTPAYTSYSPAPDVFVVDLAATTKGADLAVPASLPAGVASVAAEEAVEMGTRLTRVTFRLSQPASLQTAVADNSIIVNIPAPPVAPVPAATAVAEHSTEVPHVEPIAEPAHAAVVEPVASVEPLPAVRTQARSVKRVETSGSGSSFQLTITGDGAMKYKAFMLDAPARLVIDLDGLRNAVAKPNINVADPLVKSVRVGQFKGAPDPVARIVVDLARKSEYRVVDEGDHLRVVFGAGSIVAAQTPKLTPVTAPSTASVVVTEPAKPAATRASSASAPADIPSQVPVVAENAAWRMPEQTATPRRAKAKITSPGGQTAPTTTRTTTRKGVATTAPTSENVFETPAATDMSHSGPQVLSSTPGGRTLSGTQKVYNGEPISLNLKDADLKDVLRTFGELTGLNIAIDPNVNGVVTVNFTDVPWDQALELILRQNNLTYVLEGNVMRIGTIDRIATEATAQRKLEEENRLNVPLTTVVFKLSYARATEVQALATQLASTRARIIVDQRTNQLIVSEVPQGLAVLRNLIETVDMPTRQVMIEARIVEASKVFTQQYGFQWGFQGALDPALGNGTGLIFPNRVGYTGGPFNFSGGGNPLLSLSLTDVLGTFNLDFALNASESEGLVKVISAPKVTTQDNQAAEIQSGFQIPYQTRVNFTTTVTYVDATLRLSVTPQITEAGTVIMDIAVQKNEPTTGLAIEGAAGTPLSTRSARTRLMVRDGGTAVIGGIYQVKDNDAQSRVPFLHEIPVIGNLFKNHNISTTHDELLIFITPRIIRGT